MRGKRGTLSLTSGKSPSGIRQPSSFRQKNPSISPVTNQTSKTVTLSKTDSLPARSQESQRDQLAPSTVTRITARSTRSQQSLVPFVPPPSILRSASSSYTFFVVLRDVLLSADPLLLCSQLNLHSTQSQRRQQPQ